MAQIMGDTQRLMGPEKAAIFMLALGNEQSAKLFEMMDDEEIRELSQIMSGLGSVNARTIEQLFVDFADQIAGAGSLVGSYDSTERLLYQSLPQDRVDLTRKKTGVPPGPPSGAEPEGTRPKPKHKKNPLARLWLQKKKK